MKHAGLFPIKFNWIFQYFMILFLFSIRPLIEMSESLSISHKSKHGSGNAKQELIAANEETRA